MTLVSEREPALRFTREAVLATLRELMDHEWLKVIEREQAGASKEVVWFHRGRHAALAQAANLLDERVRSWNAGPIPPVDDVVPDSDDSDNVRPLDWRDEGNEDGSNRDVPPFDNDPRTDDEIKQAVYDRADDFLDGWDV